jgi:hypothetical protein
MPELNWEEDVRIDPDRLHIAWLEQQNLVMRYSRQVANLKRRVEKCKDRLDVIKAEIRKKVLKDPDKYGVDKVTEGAIASVIAGDEDYQEERERQLDGQYELDVVSGAIRSLEHRRSSLENLVYLLKIEYFSAPNLPKDLTKDWEEREQRKRGNAETAQILKRGKRR